MHDWLLVTATYGRILLAVVYCVCSAEKVPLPVGEAVMHARSDCFPLRKPALIASKRDSCADRQ